MQKTSVTLRKGEGENSETLTLILPYVNTDTIEGTNQVVETCKKLAGKEINVQRIETIKQK